MIERAAVRRLIPWLLLPALGLAEEAAERTIIDLGEPVWDQTLLLGVDVPVYPAVAVGLLGGYRLRRRTNFTFNDLQLFGTAAPRLQKEDTGATEAGPVTWIGSAALKTSTRNFDFPWLYAWTRYEVKSSTAEDLNLRAAIASGWGVFLWESEPGEDDVHANFDLGLLVDYASLDAYAEGVASAYLRGGLSLDVDWGPWKWEIEGNASLQLTDATLTDEDTNQQVEVNQTRFELEGSLS